MCFYTKIFDIFCAYVDHKLVFRLGLFLLLNCKIPGVEKMYY